MSHVGFADHYDPPAAPDVDAASRSARAFTGRYCGLMFADAIVALDALAAVEFETYCSELGEHCEYGIQRGDICSPVRDCLSEVLAVAMDYIEQGVREVSAGTLPAVQKHAMKRMRESHARIKPYCTHADRNKAMIMAQYERIDAALAKAEGGAE